MKTTPLCLLFLVIGLVACSSGDTANDVSGESMSIDRFFESYYQERLALQPFLATSIGENRYNDVMVDFLSDGHLQRLKDFCTKYEELAGNYPTEDLDEQHQISLKLIAYSCRIFLEGLNNEMGLVMEPPYLQPQFIYMPINQIFSFHLFMGQLAGGRSIQPFETVEDYENWLHRVDGYTGWLQSVMSRMRQGLEKGLVLPKIIVERTIGQLEDMKAPGEEHLFYIPVLQMPERFSDQERATLRASFHEMVEHRVIPAYETLIRFLKEDYLPHCRETAGIGSLPGGRATYEYLVKFYTTTDMSPEAIFELGQKEVERLTNEMEKVKSQVEFEGDLKAFFHHLRARKELMPFTDPQEVIDRFNSIHERMKPQLERLFDLKPKTGFEVRRTEAFREASASAEYLPGSPDGSRKGVFYVPIPDVRNYNILSDEDLFLHEAIPGHHYQISIQQESTSLPKFQRSFVEYAATIEGWALYAESLGKELGLYNDPYQYFGMLTAEMHRAIRLVVDVGLHTKGWTREEAIRYSLDHEAELESAIISEIERYMVGPGQALSYKIGQLKILELRERAEKELGDRFSIKEFHNEVLEYGSLPLVILEEKIDRWIGKMTSSTAEE